MSIVVPLVMSTQVPVAMRSVVEPPPEFTNQPLAKLPLPIITRPEIFRPKRLGSSGPKKG